MAPKQHYSNGSEFHGWAPLSAPVVRVEVGATKRERWRAVIAVAFWAAVANAIGLTWHGSTATYVTGIAVGVEVTLLWRYNRLIWHGVHSLSLKRDRRSA